ncbi:phage baseplate assembly protein V [Maridesulfovibrio ferrireducens]|uniref:phage baseplate assembly protein V n=1 Tax=Maridesulfovibrio ferrireducens TaxID=246191 RepID=UPI001A21AFF5|nr:phage baseplate assembly protein V [Maridesulfovibrio ferrireducens]MBI9110114.1 phage baseplate assembly protein V [Maridesulfovibrio ferrireducens]
MSQGNPYQQSETDRRLSNLIRIGTVAEADYSKARVRVSFGEAVSDWLPWVTFRAGGDHTWWAPEVGEQVIVLSPSGEISGGVVLGSIFSTDHPAPADRPTIHRTTYEDGAVIEYDRLNHILHAYIPGFENREIDKDMTVQVHRDVFRTIDRDDFKQVVRDVFNDIGGNRTDTIGGNVSDDIGGDVNRTVGGKVVLDVQGEVVINSASRITLSAPLLVLDGPFVQGNSNHGGGGEFYGKINQHNGDFVSDGVSLQHHVHPEKGTVTDEPTGGAL